MHRVSPIKKDRSHSRSLLRFGALAVFAGLGAGCSADAVRLTDPLFTSSTANQQAIVSGQPYTANSRSRQNLPPAPTNVAAVRSDNNIQRQPLPEPLGQAYRPAELAPVRTAGVQPATGKPQPYTPPKPYAASGQPKPLGALPANRTANAAPQTASSSGTYVVKPGDSLWSIANRNGTTVSALQSANNLPGNSIRSGQRLVMPGSSAAPVQVAAIAPKTMNDASIPVPAPVRKKPVEAKPVAAIQPSNGAVKPTGYTAPNKIVPEQPVAPTASRDAAKPAEPVKTAANNASGFRWPVRGRIISGFGKKPNGERNDGIDLAVPEGTSVKAAESGVVIYAGNELKSYGNLVLVRHDNGWVSAYAHNKELLVKRGDNVQRGQVISRAGRSGGVDTPQVHFELRKGATPVDPMQHLSDA
jgi:murein DD-endopeptidase MepM/ murein hydrolase activator NlpD